MAKRVALFLASALCVRSQGIEFEALDALNAETNGPHYNQLEGPFVASAAAIQGYSDPVSLGNLAISVPTCGSADTYLGVRIFTSGQFNTTLCTDACSSVSACQFVNVYNLYAGSNLVGQFCALYSRSWDASYSYNIGQYRGGDLYTISDSYGFSNLGRLAVPASCPDEECKREIVQCLNNNRPQAADYCSNLTPFTTTVATVTPTSLHYCRRCHPVNYSDNYRYHDPNGPLVHLYRDRLLFGHRAAATETGSRRPDLVYGGHARLHRQHQLPPDRITSACSCFGVPAQTVSVTSTAPAATVTNTNTFQATTTIEVATTHVTTTVTTTTGVVTVSVPAPTPSPLDFEAADQSGTWQWSSNNPNGWSMQVVPTANRTGQATRSFEVVNSQYLGFAILQQVQSFYLQPGATYQVTLYAHATVMGSGNSITNVYLQMVTATGYSCGPTWNPLPNGGAGGQQLVPLQLQLRPAAGRRQLQLSDPRGLYPKPDDERHLCGRFLPLRGE
ncbi:hypothetical protein PG984_015432 [Apiospora sp. TS-2023a]